MTWRRKLKSSGLLLSLAALMGLAPCPFSLASEVIVSGTLVSNEPMNCVKHECADNQICLSFWWRSVIQVNRTIQGAHLSGRIAAAVMQHGSMTKRFRKAVRLFVLVPIEDKSKRAKLRASYYLVEAAEPGQPLLSADKTRRIGTR